MGEDKIITREDFYTAFEKLRNMNKTFKEIEKFLGTELTEGRFGSLYDDAFDIFTTLVFGKDYIDECIYDAVHGDDEIDFMMEPDEGFNADYSNGIPCSLTYDQYYDYFVRRKYDYPEA
jgi:hypothetical protein